MSRVRADLQPHPGNPAGALDVRIAATVERTARGFDFQFELAGQLDGIAWPAAAGAGRAERLWQHTCFEAFCATPGASAYYEFNFAPSGAYAVYRFGGYRERLADPELLAPPGIAQREAGALTLVEVVLDVAGLPRLRPGAPVEVALAVVLEDRSARLHYYALGHPAAAADFHDRRAFLVSLPALGGPAR